jgi:oxepin-CoA hydrolase/3-oxo-5,6-dehydrosuberyl-CoA semialdehyde dehydrogenase
MDLINVNSYLAGHWTPADAGARGIFSAVTGERLALAGQDTIDTPAMLDFAGSRAVRRSEP